MDARLASIFWFVCAMNIGILLPGFSASEDDWAIPVQLNLVREMARHEDVRVLALRYPHHREAYAVHGARVFPLGVGQARGLGRLKLWRDALLSLRRLHRERSFDVLHAMWADETGLVASWAGRLLGVPVVVSVAGGELVGLDDIAYGLQRGPFSRWIVGQALGGAQQVIVACDYARRLIAQAGYAVPDARLRTVPLGVDVRVFQPADMPKRIRHLVHVASLVGVKDQITLLRALALLDGVTLDIVGDGPERLNLQGLAGQLEIANRVTFAGSVAHPDLPPYYQRASLNILTSRHEGLGMVILEAAACGTPTVSTAVGLLPDWPQMGVAVPVGDYHALANRIHALLNEPSRLAALSQSAYTTAVQEFSIQRTVERFLEIYRQIQPMA